MSIMIAYEQNLDKKFITKLNLSREFPNLLMEGINKLLCLILRITFSNKKESNVQASALVFELISKITDRISLETWHIKAQLYKCEEIKIDVKNHFE